MLAVACVFLAPLLVLLLVYIVYPIIDSFYISLFQWNGISSDRKFIGLNNWLDLIFDDKFWFAAKNNFIITILSIVLQIPIGLAMATFLEFGGRKLNVFKVVWFIPHLMSSVAIGFLFAYALATNGGIISTISHLFGGGNVDLLGNKDTALYTVIAVICWQFAPFYMVYFVASYTGIPIDLYEAAVIDGATRGQYFWKIALPLLKPAVKSAAILSMVGSLKYFDLIYVMTSGGPGSSTELMATYMYKLSFSQFNMGYGSCVASGMFLISNSDTRQCCYEIASSVYYNYINDTGSQTDDRLISYMKVLRDSDKEQACEVTRIFLRKLLDENDQKDVHEILSKSKRYIAEHLSEDLSVAHIAAELYLTPNYFSRLFKRVAGEGCNEYIVRKRIEKAKILLQTTNLKASKIADMVGYRDTNYFSLAFKKNTGVSPTKYREQFRQPG